MTNNPSLLKLLFATFPPQTGDAAAMMEAYDLAIEGHDARDIEAAVRKFVRGEVPLHNPSFAPSAALLGGAIRQCMNDRLDSDARARKPALPPPDIPKTPESRERVRALAASFSGAVDAMRTADAKRSRRSLADHDAFFDIEPVSRVLAKQLGVGDPEGDSDAA